ncbi:hypothetical protein FHG64_03070 [Antarcticibacterium flavum]|uniref:Lipocalin-like domain-containing protein n=1 Tax=Antarcticibacterium flavum TaxID=2058175 RepID=A0A5B7X198_9FLAO|nr:MULTISPECIES: hypothetical protein [Antarcticibacterium]MCM4161231.1 hypothetical protein [Antarcticibacterium sp. W02-3]QCY68452.1 hypothetical protein FHG64_03070 [Antarcticibacterium flavum]
MKRILLIILIILTGCSRDSSPGNSKIFGTWGRSFAFNPAAVGEEGTGNLLSVTRYIFKNDYSFESFTFLMNEDSMEIPGYWSRKMGTFTQQGNRLFLIYDLYNTGGEALSDFPHIDKEDLVLAAEGVEWEFNFSILEDNSILKFEFDPCGPLENCVGEMTLVRVK